MKKLRRLMLWLGLIFIALLAVFSTIGAFLGAENAQKFFNSIPLALYWTFFGIILAASIAVFPRLLKSPGLLAMHAGCVLIIAGSMWGSQSGHEVQRKYFGSNRVQSSRMSILEGYSEDKLYLGEGSKVNQSLTSIKMSDFTIKYSYDSQSIDFVSGDEIIRQEPVVLDQKIDTGIDNCYVTPLKFFHNLGFKTVDGQETAFDKPGGGSNPALEIKLVDCDGKKSTRLLADTSVYSLPFLIRLNDFRIEYYKKPMLLVLDEKGLVWSGRAEIGTTIDLGAEYGKITPTKVFGNLFEENGEIKDNPGAANNPAVEVIVDFPGLPQETVYTYENYPDFCVVENKYVIRYKRTIRDFISELDIVTEDGRVLASKSIEVNKPLHYGGYHFYQSEYRQTGPDSYATILLVTSDSGLYCVFTGFFAMCGGILYHQWLRPVLKKKRDRKKYGN